MDNQQPGPSRVYDDNYSVINFVPSDYSESTPIVVQRRGTPNYVLRTYIQLLAIGFFILVLVLLFIT